MGLSRDTGKTVPRISISSVMTTFQRSANGFTIGLTSCTLRRSPARKPDSAVGGVPVERQQNAGCRSSQNRLILRFSPKSGQRRFVGAIVPVDPGTWKDDRSGTASLRLESGLGVHDLRASLGGRRQTYRRIARLQDDFRARSCNWV